MVVRAPLDNPVLLWAEEGSHILPPGIPALFPLSSSPFVGICNVWWDGGESGDIFICMCVDKERVCEEEVGDCTYGAPLPKALCT